MGGGLWGMPGTKGISGALKEKEGWRALRKGEAKGLLGRSRVELFPHPLCTREVHTSLSVRRPLGKTAAAYHSLRRQEEGQSALTPLWSCPETKVCSFTHSRLQEGGKSKILPPAAMRPLLLLTRVMLQPLQLVLENRAALSTYEHCAQCMSSFWLTPLFLALIVAPTWLVVLPWLMQEKFADHKGAVSSRCVKKRLILHYLLPI